MIILYYRSSHSSSRKAEKWFMKQEINIHKKRIEYISKKELIHVLCMSNRGFQDILKQTNISTPHVQNMLQKVSLMSFNESIDFILMHPELLKVPIIVDDCKLIVGYNAEIIRTFIPRKRRAFQSDRF